MIYLDKLDKALERWSRDNKGDGLASTLEAWLSGIHDRLVEDECTVVFCGRDRNAVPESLIRQFDKALIA